MYTEGALGNRERFSVGKLRKIYFLASKARRGIQRDKQHGEEAFNEYTLTESIGSFQSDHIYGDAITFTTSLWRLKGVSRRIFWVCYLGTKLRVHELVLPSMRLCVGAASKVTLRTHDRRFGAVVLAPLYCASSFDHVDVLYRYPRDQQCMQATLVCGDAWKWRR